jgi:geranylgeranyl diphosphate synthase, type I
VRTPNSQTAVAGNTQWLLGGVEETLQRFLAAKSGLWVEPVPYQVFPLLSEFVSRPGKRVRPQFCYWGWVAAGGDGTDLRVAQVAASLEMLHTFALIHDDIMDASDLRRGAPTLHRALAQLHKASAWRGDCSRFGASVALLCGDLCLVWADEMFHETTFPPDVLQAAYPWLARMRTDMCTGQFLDLREQACGGTLAGAIQVIDYKTARYTVQGPLQIGGALAGAHTDVMACLRTFGEAVGEAYQLRDDVLGVFGDPAVTGKSNMDDLRDGKPTVQMAFARQRASAAQERQIQALHGNPELDGDGADVLREILLDTGAVTSVEELVSQRTTAAHQALARASMPELARLALAQLAATATKRMS